MDSAYELLVEKEEMWARMLMEVLEDNGIPCTALPVFGAALSLRGGTPERFEVYVPKEHLPRASELVDELFSCDFAEDEDEN